MADNRKLTVICPCCEAELQVDGETGLVFKSQNKQLDYSLETALQKEVDRRDQADQVFADAFRKEEDRHASLEEKFKKALEAKDELADPDRPWDFD